MGSMHFFFKAPKIGIISGCGHLWGDISDMKLLLQGYWGCRVVMPNLGVATVACSPR